MYEVKLHFNTGRKPVLINSWITITHNTGEGQTRRLKGIDQGIITVEPAWDVEPDDTSVFQIWPERTGSTG